MKVTVRQQGGAWPNLVVGTAEGGTTDLTNAEEVSLWVYFDSANNMDKFAFKVNNGEGVNQMFKGFTLVAKTWTKITITKAEILKDAANIDLTKVRICICQNGSTYDDRANFYVDDLMVK